MITFDPRKTEANGDTVDAFMNARFRNVLIADTWVVT